MPQNKNYASNKTKAVAWFVSNCGARNGRLNYAKELQKYIQASIKKQPCKLGGFKPILMNNPKNWSGKFKITSFNFLQMSGS
jgi:hypothetical protein